MKGLFQSLSPERQIEALQTMAALWQSDPPRHDISLEAISAALRCEDQLLQAAWDGRWEESALLELEARITAVGGRLASGLRSSGPDSLQTWRDQSFGRLASRLTPPVQAAALAALGAVLRRQRPANLAGCFALLHQQLAPLLQEGSGSPWGEVLLALEPQRQVAVFDAWRTAQAAPAPRQPPALIATIAAFAAEAELLRAATTEAPLRPALAAMARALQEAGSPLLGLPDAASLGDDPGAERELDAPGLRRRLRTELQQQPASSARELLERIQELAAASAAALAADPGAARDPAWELAVLERYDVTGDALRRRLVRELVDDVTFPEDAMAEVIRELLDDLAIPPPYPERLDPDWLLTLSSETRLALMDSWEDRRLRHWIEAHYSERAEQTFAERSGDFDRYVYECIQVSDAALAQQLHQLLLLSGNTLGDLAAGYSEGEERWTRGVVGPLPATALAPELRALLARLAPGELQPPCQLDGRHRIVRLLHRFPARLDQTLRQELMWELFEADLEASVSHHLGQLDPGNPALPPLFEALSLLG